MAKLIFISGTPTSKIVGDKLNINYYEKNGFIVEFWNLTLLYHSKASLAAYFGGHSDYRFQFTIERNFTTRAELKIALQNLTSNVLFCHLDFSQHDDYWLRRLFKVCSIRYYVGPKRTSENFINNNGQRLSINSFIYKALSSIKARISARYLKEKFCNTIYKCTNYYQKPKFVIGSGTKGRFEWLRATQADYFVSVPSHDVIMEKLPKTISKSYCVYVDDAVIYSPDQIMTINKQSTCLDIEEYSTNIRTVFDMVEKTLDCQVVVATSGKYKYPDSKIFGGREIFYSKTNQLIQHSCFVLGHASSAVWQVIIDLKPIILLQDPSFIKAKNVSVGLQGAFIGVSPIQSTKLMPSDLKVTNINLDHFRFLTNKYFCEVGVKGSAEEVIKNELNKFLRLEKSI